MKSKKDLEKDLDTAYNLIPLTGFIMFVVGLVVGKFFLGFW